MIHLSLGQLSAYLDGEVLESSAEPIRRHIEECASCGLTLASLRGLEAALRRALTHDPGETFFEQLPSKVERRIAEAKASASRSVAARAPVSARPPSRTKAAVTPGPPSRTKAAKAAEVPKATRAAEPAARTGERVPRRAAPLLHPRRRSTDRRVQAHWLAAAVLVVIAGAVGIVVAPREHRERPPENGPSRQPELSPPQPEAGTAVGPGPDAARVPDSGPIAAGPKLIHEPAPKPERPQRPRPAHATTPKARAVEPEEQVAERAPRNLVPVRRIVTVTETTVVRPPEPAPTPRQSILPSPAEARPFATAPAAAQPLVLEAEEAAKRASIAPTATNYDAAADEWDRAIPVLAGTPHQTIARQRLADARFRAWEAEPNVYRSASAIAALRRYIVFAPDGPERSAAREELARLLH